VSGFNPKWIVGKTIKSIDMRPFDSGGHAYKREKAFDPIITFDDGSSITFSTQETEVGEYGTDITYYKAISA
jgi:hypothetical protein